MKKVRVWLYKTQWQFKKKYMVSQAISIRTLSKYSHIEIEDVETGLCYTSTMRDEDNGTVVRDSAIVLRHIKHWHCIEIEVGEMQHKMLFWWLQQKVDANKGYSTRDILKFISPVHFPDNLRDICSELINNGCVIIGLIFGFGIVSPAKVAKKLVKQGHVIIKGEDVRKMAA